MKNAIELAIKGGFRPQDYGFTDGSQELYGNQFEIEGENEVHIFTVSGREFWIHTTQITSDPLFWQALGKAMGKEDDYAHYVFEDEDMLMDWWRANWHNFIDHLAEGKDADSFFEDLLNNK